MFRRKGFTLIELIIVIAVISILIGIALPRFKGMQESAQVAQAKGELRTIQTAMESFRTHTGAYPAALTDLEGATPDIIGPDLPTDPFGTDYTMATDGQDPVEYYVLYSDGPGTNAGAASVTAAGVVSQSAGDPIYVTNGGPRDATP